MVFAENDVFLKLMTKLCDNEDKWVWMGGYIIGRPEHEYESFVISKL
jgi:hypothetical protein